MEEQLLIGLAGIIVIGVCAQWIAWRLQFPSILLLLLLGFLAGPVTGFLRPDEMFGPILLPVVSLSVALILFEGGLSLRFSEIRPIWGVVRNLLLIGSLTVWAVASLAAMVILGMEPGLAILLGAILVVTGPTVVGPLLRHVRPSGQVGSILKWEGILIDPIGGMFAVLVFEALRATEARDALGAVALAVVLTIVIGSVVGTVTAVVLIQMLKRHWIPDFLQSPSALMAVLAAFAVSNYFQAESGLLTVTVMGIVLANQKEAFISHIIEFKENLRVLLISGLFIVLAARVEFGQLAESPWRGALFVLLLIVVARPLSVALSTLGAKMSWQERTFLASVAPRGIVAAAVSSVFALRLEHDQVEHVGQELLAPVTFLTIVGTVTVYSAAASPLARWLGLSQPNPQGVLIMGAHQWARAIAAQLRGMGFSVLLVDTNWTNVSAARLEGLPAYFGNGLAEHDAEEIDLAGIGRFVALTPNHGTNSLAALHFSEVFGRNEVYQLASDEESNHPRRGMSEHLKGRDLVGPEATYAKLTRLTLEGWEFKTTRLTEEFDFVSYREVYGGDAMIFALIDSNMRIRFVTAGSSIKPKPGITLLALVKAPVEEEPQGPFAQPKEAEEPSDS